MDANLNYLLMTAKKPSLEAIKIFSDYVQSVWIDFDNLEEKKLIQTVAENIKMKKEKRKKKQ